MSGPEADGAPTFKRARRSWSSASRTTLRRGDLIAWMAQRPHSGCRRSSGRGRHRWIPPPLESCSSRVGPSAGEADIVRGFPPRRGRTLSPAVALRLGELRFRPALLEPAIQPAASGGDAPRLSHNPDGPSRRPTEGHVPHKSRLPDPPCTRGPTGA